MFKIRKLIDNIHNILVSYTEKSQIFNDFFFNILHFYNIHKKLYIKKKEN